MKIMTRLFLIQPLQHPQILVGLKMVTLVAIMMTAFLTIALIMSADQLILIAGIVIAIQVKHILIVRKTAAILIVRGGAALLAAQLVMDIMVAVIITVLQNPHVMVKLT